MRQDKWSDLREAVKRRVADSPSPMPTQSTQKKKVPQRLYTMGLLVLALTLGVFIFAINQLESNQSGNVVIETPSTEIRVDTPKVNTPPVIELQSSNEVEDLKRKVKIMDAKIMLLGSAHNNNWHVLQNRYSGNDLVYFGGDWRLNQMPPHIQLVEKDKAWFADWVQ